MTGTLRFAGTLAAGLLISTAASAADIPHMMTVNSHGEVNAAPDQASISAGVTTQAASADAALSANANRMSRVLAALKGAGIPDKDIRTSNFSVEPQYPLYNANNPNDHRIIGYQVSNEVDVTLERIANLGPTIDALVAAGANQMNAISFSIRDSRTLTDHARAMAVADAIDRAHVLATAAHVTLGSIVSIEEGTTAPRPIFPMMRAQMAVAESAAPTPIATGEATLSADVAITWEIK